MQNHTATSLSISFTSTGHGIKTVGVGPYTSFSLPQPKEYATISGTFTIVYDGDVGPVYLVADPQVIVNFSNLTK